MKIIKGICGLVLFICLVGIALVPFMHEAGTLNFNQAALGIVTIALTATIAFIGIIIAENFGSSSIDFAEFIHQEYISGRITTNLKKKCR